MIYLFTGLPGEGKTLNALDFVIQLQFSQEKKRRVYYANFQKFENGKAFDENHPEFSKVADWIEVTQTDLTTDLPKLYDSDHPVEHGSIVLIDECQDFYPTRQKAAVPEFLKFFEKHRHTGVDFVIVTQKIRQIDIHLRSLVGEHQDFKRIMGRDAVRVKKLNRCMEGEDLKSSEILTSTKRYPKNLFGLYKSSNLHTHKKKLPKVLLLFPVAIVFILVMLYILYDSLFVRDEPQKEAFSHEKTQLLEKKIEPLTLQEKIDSFNPSLVSKKYRILYFDTGDRVRITDEKAVYNISKKQNCLFHPTFRFVCFFDNEFLILRGNYEKNSDDSTSGIL